MTPVLGDRRKCWNLRPWGRYRYEVVDEKDVGIKDIVGGDVVDVGGVHNGSCHSEPTVLMTVILTWSRTVVLVSMTTEVTTWTKLITSMLKSSTPVMTSFDVTRSIVLLSSLLVWIVTEVVVTGSPSVVRVLIPVVFMSE